MIRPGAVRGGLAGSVAIHRDGALIAHQELFLEKSHSGLLTIMIDDLIDHCGIGINDLNAVALSEGPGSYTGLRIGASTAKGLAYSLEIPLIGVSTSEAMCRSVTLYDPKPILLCPMLDARRMEVYCLVANQDYEVIQEVHPHIVDQSSFLNILTDNKVVFFGNGASKCKEHIIHQNAFFIESVTPNAKHIGNLAYLKYKNDEFLDLAYFEPFYLKDFRPTQPSTL